MIKHLAKEILIGFLLASITSSTLFSSLLLPIPEAQAASNMCSAEDIQGYLHDPNYEPRKIFLPGKDGGVKLDQAAEFLADMSDLTGAYYDEGRDQIVFVGTKETTIPKFDKDDLAVAIRSIFFAEANPGLKIEYKAPEDFDTGKEFTNNDEMNVNVMPSREGDQGNRDDQWKDDKEQMRDATLYGIEDTAFAKILFDADWKLKQYWMGYGKEHTDPNVPEKLRSNVPGYASFYDRYNAKGASGAQKSVIRVWLRPQKITLKLDETSDAFLFDQVKMELITEHFFGENKDANWAAAATEFAQHHTDNFDTFAAETPAYDQVKRLAKIVSVVKWLKDNNITTDFHWARHYEPAYVATPRTTKMIVGGSSSTMVAGSLSFPSQNVYTPGNGAGSSLKTSALASQATSAEFHWNFTNNNQSYEAVAVSAEIFRNAGAYTSGVTDLSLETIGDIPIAFSRTYSSQMNERTYVSATSLGKGWEALPARLTDIDPTQAPACGSADQPSGLSFETQAGAYETFTFNCTSNTYQPDHPFYTSKLNRNADGTYILTRKDLTAYTFDRLTRFYGEIFRLRSIADRNGNTIHYDYREPSANLYRISDDHGQFIEINFGPFQRVKDATDHTGRSVKYTYDDTGRLTSVTDVAGRTTQYQYDGDNRLTAVIDPEGQSIMQAQYNELNKVTSQTDALGRAINITYDETTRMLTAQDSTGTTERNIYDADARLVESIDPVGKSTKYAYGTFRAPETVTDKRGNVTRYQYDARGNVTKVTAPDNLSVDTAYNTADLPTQITDGRYSPGRTTAFTYDVKNNLTKQDTAGISQQVTLDSAGQVVQATGPSGQTTAYQYNSLGLPATVTDALGNVTRYEYDSLGRVTKATDPNGVSTTYTYDAAGSVLTETNAAGKTTYAYDSLDRVTKVTLPDGTTAQYTYDPANQISKVTDAKGNGTTYTYDTKGNLISRKTAAGTEYKSEYDALSRPTKAITPLGKTSQSTYDANGNPTAITDPANKVMSQEFDVLNRLTKSNFSDQTAITRTYDGRGNITAASDPAGQLVLTYDIFDRLTQSKDSFGNAVSYAYDASGRRTSLTYPSGQKVNYAYDADDELTSVTDWNSQATQLTYYPNGLLKDKKLPNGITTHYDYDSANRMNRLTYLDGSGQPLAQTDIERSLVGNVTKLIESGPLFTQPVGTPPSPTPTPSSSPTPTPTPTPPPPPPSGDLTFTLQTDQAWGIDVGSNAAPTIADLDQDGKLDLLVGEYSGNINHYEQTGTQPTDSFALVTPNFFNIDAGNYSKPELADIDGDGDLDLFIGGYYGRILYYPNTGSASQPAFSSTGTLYNSIDVGDYSAPRWVDIDADGDLDLFLGNSSGTLTYYKNTGSKSSAQLQLSSSNFSSIDIGSHSTPFFADFDKDQDLDLVIGTSDGKIKYYKNTGTAQAATYTLVSTIASNIDVGSNSAPAAQDLTGDGLLDLLIGDSGGNLELWVASNNGSSTAALPESRFFGLIPAAHAQSAGQLVLYDDFNTGSSPDSAKWNTSGSATIESGRLKLNAIGQSSSANTNNKSPGNGIPDGFNITGTEFWYQYGGGGPEGTDRRWGITNGTDYIRLKSEHVTGISRWETGGAFSGGGGSETSNGTVKVLVEDGAVNVYYNDVLRFTAKAIGGMPTGIYFFADAPQIGGSENFLLIDNVKFWLEESGGGEVPPPPTGSLVTTFAYDVLGQLTKAIYPDTQTFDYAYDAIGNRTGNTYDADAKLLQAGNTTFTYDDNGALKTKQASAKVTGYLFNARQQLTRVGDGTAPSETWELTFTNQTTNAWGIDVGSNAAPTIADLDNDGKLDLLIGEYSGNVNHYEQTSANPSANFTLVTEKLAGFDIGSYAAPALADIDADGDLDLFVGTSTGVIYLYRNTGSATSPAFSLESNKFLNIDVGDNAAPTFTDIDNDGDLDLFIGAKDGTIKSYKNFGTKQTANFALDSSKYGNIDIGDYAVPVFVNLDSDSDLDLLVGKSDGTISSYVNQGTTSASNFQLQSSKFQNIDVGSRSTPTLWDLTGDSLPDLLVGESGGKLQLFNASKKVTTPPDPSPKFTYDALGNRIKKTVNGTETRYVNDITGELPYVLAELNNSNQPQSLYLYAGGLASMGGTASTSRIYLLADPLGNIRFLTDSTGKLVARYAYDPYGNVRKKEGTTNSTFTFAGEQFDPETSLTFLRARYYDPATGMFLSRDPVLGPLVFPLEHGEYLYTRNNPINLSDPSGLFALIFKGSGTAALGAPGLATGGTVSGGFVLLWGDNGFEWGRIYEGGTGFTTGADLSLGVGGTLSKARNLSDLAGTGIDISVSGKYGAGLSGGVGLGPGGISSISVGVGLGGALRSSTYASYAVVYDRHGNVILPNELVESLNAIKLHCKAK